MKKLTLTSFLFSFIVFSITVFSQSSSDKDFNKTISNLSSAAAIPYVNPATNSFGSNLNTGWVTKAPAATKLSFSLDLKIIAMGTIINDDQRTFSSSGAFRFTSSQADQLVSQIPAIDRQNIKTQILNQEFHVGIAGPTIVGAGDQNVKVTFNGQSFTSTNTNITYTIPTQAISLSDVKGFLDGLSIFPTAAIQLGIGTFMGTNFAFRWFPKVNIKDLGDFTYWGIGATHNPAVWFDGADLPLDISFGVFYQDLQVGTIFETKATQFGIYGSKTLGTVIAFTPYFGITSETSTTTINYDYEFSDVNNATQKANVNFELKGTNTVGFTVGAAFKLAILNLNIDYKFANINTASAGLTFGF